MQRSGVALTALAAALLLTGAACSSGSDPGPNYSSVSTTPSSPIEPSTPSTATSSNPNVPSGASSPTQPNEALRNSTDGAFAFVSFYWKQVDWAYSIVDGNVLSGLYRPTCKSCASSEAAIKAVQAKGNTFRGGHVTIKSQRLGSASADPSANYAVDTVLSVEALTELTAQGAKVASYPASSYTVRAFVAWSTDHFEVTATANLGGGS
ncbi:DUF6318 family protein [Jatrophihabitans sp. YIM 134969]